MPTEEERTAREVATYLNEENTLVALLSVPPGFRAPDTINIPLKPWAGSGHEVFTKTEES